MFWVLFTLLAFTAYSQDSEAVEFDEEAVENVLVTPRGHQNNQVVLGDKQACFAHADEEVDAWKHRTLKETGIGVGVGAVIGKIFGKPGIGAVGGGAAGGIHGHKKAKEEKRLMQQEYASCLRDKGYEVQELGVD